MDAQQAQEDLSQMQLRPLEQDGKCTEDLHASQAEVMVGKSEPESKRPRHEAELSSLEDKQLEAKNQLQRGVRSSDTALEQGQHRFRQLDSQEAQALCVPTLLQKLAKLEQKTDELNASFASKVQRQREMEQKQFALQKQLEDEAATRKEMFLDLDNKLSQHIERHYCVQDRMGILEQVIGGTDETMVDEEMSQVPFTQRLRHLEQLVQRESVTLERLNSLEKTVRDAWKFAKLFVARVDGLQHQVGVEKRTTERYMWKVDRVATEKCDLVERVHRLERQFWLCDDGKQAPKQAEGEQVASLKHRMDFLEKAMGVGDSSQPASEACAVPALASSVEKVEGPVSQKTPLKVSLTKRIELLESFVDTSAEHTMNIEQTLGKRVDVLECCMADKLGQAAEAETLRNRQTAAARARAKKAELLPRMQSAVKLTRKRRHR